MINKLPEKLVPDTQDLIQNQDLRRVPCRRYGEAQTADHAAGKVLDLLQD